MDQITAQNVQLKIKQVRDKSCAEVDDCTRNINQCSDDVAVSND